MMSEHEGPGEAVQDEQQINAEKSPTEKLEGEQPTGPLTPGAQNPESTEIKQEKSPNSE